jgi:hypothetical protein
LIHDGFFSAGELFKLSEKEKKAEIVRKNYVQGEK